jgi:hypothetical protein
MSSQPDEERIRSRVLEPRETERFKPKIKREFDRFRGYRDPDVGDENRRWEPDAKDIG